MAVAKFSRNAQSSYNVRSVKLSSIVVKVVKGNTGPTTKSYAVQFHTCQAKQNQKHWILVMVPLLVI